MSIGWIQLHRSIQDHWIYDNPIYLKAWICILLNVNHEDKKVTIDNELFECRRGSSLKSMSTWVRLFGKNWTNKKVRTFFKLLKDDSMIEYKGLRKTSHLTVCNYDTYQSKGDTEGNTEGTQKAHRGNTEVTQKATNNNDNNYNNENNEEKIKLHNSINEKLWFAFLDIRKTKGKKDTLYSMNIFIKKLIEYESIFKGAANKSLENSIVGQYPDLYTPTKEVNTSAENWNPWK